MDLRIEKTYRALFEAFTALLEEHRFEDVTVAMLCKRAMIRRTTFYKHFRDKNTYFAFYIDELMDSLAQGEDAADGRPVDYKDVRQRRRGIFNDAMRLILEHEKLMDNIFDSSMMGTMTDIICDRISASIRERVMSVVDERALAPVPLEVTADFVAGGMVRLFKRWWKEGHEDRDFSEMADVVDTLFERAMTPVPADVLPALALQKGASQNGA